jgi:hypothetical protein
MLNQKAKAGSQTQAIRPYSLALSNEPLRLPRRPAVANGKPVSSKRTGHILCRADHQDVARSPT